MKNINTKDFILQSDFLDAENLKQITTKQWHVVYNSFRRNDEHEVIYSALIPIDKVENCLKKPSWDLRIGDGYPQLVVRNEGENKKVEYHRYGCHNSLEPLVFIRDYYGLRKRHVEISEEYRHFHTAYWDSTKHILIKFSNDGSEDVIGRVNNQCVELRRAEVIEFMSAKHMYLATYFDKTRFADVDIESIPKNDQTVSFKNEFICYELNIRDNEFAPEKGKVFSRSLGKVLLSPPAKDILPSWCKKNEEESFPDYIIGVSNEGKPLSYTCNPDELANYFEANPDAPHYLTPVFFKKDVLSRYYSNPAKYKIDDGMLSCTTLWALQIDNNIPGYVVVFLGDIGEYLPEKERWTWKTFNVIPDGSISKANFRRSFLAEWAEPESLDLVFKQLYTKVVKVWHEKYGWNLFLPLHEADQNCFDTLRLPLTEDQNEFDSQVLNLTKLIIDSLNERSLSDKCLGISSDDKGLVKLEKFFNAHSFDKVNIHLDFLRQLQALRSSSVAHRKGTKYDNIYKQLGIEDTGFISSFGSIMQKACTFLDDILMFCEQ